MYDAFNVQNFIVVFCIATATALAKCRYVPPELTASVCGTSVLMMLPDS